MHEAIWDSYQCCSWILPSCLQNLLSQPVSAHPCPQWGVQCLGLWLELLWLLWMLAPGWVNGMGPGYWVLPGSSHRELSQSWTPPPVKHSGVRPVLPLSCRKGTNKVTQHKLPETSKRDENLVHLQHHAPRQPSPLFVAQEPFPTQWQ